MAVPLAVATGNPLLFLLLGLACWPLIFLWGPAAVSDRCDRMLDHMNEVRADMAQADESAKAETGSKVFALLRYSIEFNRGQGIGFIMLGQTVNKRVLSAIFLSVFGVATPVIQILVGIGQGNVELLELAEELHEVERNLTAVQGGG